MNIAIYFLLSVNTKDILKNAEVQTSLYAIDVHCTENFFFKISGVGLAYYIYKLHCCIITFLTFFFLSVLDRICLLLSERLCPVVQ